MAGMSGAGGTAGFLPKKGGRAVPENSGEKSVRRVVGLMSGTSVDGIDAALVEIRGTDDLQVKLLAFADTPYPPQVRAQIFRLFHPQEATVDRLGYMNFLLGELFAAAARQVIEKAGLTPAQVDLIGSHGQTIWHAPAPDRRDGYDIRFTVQIGEGAVIAERTGIPCVSDFRVADMAAGGEGAPLVPYTEFLLYRRADCGVLLQNIGGIGNITVLPAACRAEDVFAFDTGPGNMLIDGAVARLTGGRQRMDAGGAMAAQGRVCPELLETMRREPYFSRRPPKTTGRELFGEQFLGRIFAWAEPLSLSPADLVATVTALTSWSIADAYRRFIRPVCRAGELIIGGGGSYNPTLMEFIRREFAPMGVRVLTQEELGLSSDAKEAVAFAVLADRAAMGRVNSLPAVTGARHGAVLGKLSLPAPGAGKERP